MDPCTLKGLIILRLYHLEFGCVYILELPSCFSRLYRHNILCTRICDSHSDISGWSAYQISWGYFYLLDIRQTMRHLSWAVCLPTCVYDPHKQWLRLFLHLFFRITALVWLLYLVLSFSRLLASGIWAQKLCDTYNSKWYVLNYFCLETSKESS